MFAVSTLSAMAQTPETGLKTSLLVGDVAEVNAAAGKLSLKIKDGMVEVILNAATEYKKVLPEKPTDLNAAIASTLEDIGVGDRLIASGIVSADKKSIAARRVILMTKSDIGKKLQAEAEAWRSGVSGKVTMIDVLKGEITVTSRGAFGDRTVIVDNAAKAKFRRYAPDSVKFSDAKDSSFSEVAIGDQVRARGTRSADGARLAADEVITGSFRTVGGNITAIDSAKNEITIKDIQTNKAVVIALNDASMMRRFPPEMAQRMAQMQAMRAGAGGGGNVVTLRPGGGNTQGGNPPAGGQPTGQPSGQAGLRGPGVSGSGMGRGIGGPGGGAGGGLDDMLDRLPAVTIAELKVGEAIAVSSTTGKEANRLTAIKLVAGVEAFFAVPVAPQGGGGRGSGGPSFSIPGLDGIGP